MLNFFGEVKFRNSRIVVAIVPKSKLLKFNTSEIIFSFFGFAISNLL